MTSCFGDQAVPMMTSGDNVGEGWHPLIRELEEKLNAIDPDYEIQQVKEKFGGLRYYAHTRTAGDGFHDFHRAIDVAEETSFKICEVCGEPGETKATHHWLKTLCEKHRAEDERRYKEEAGEYL